MVRSDVNFGIYIQKTLSSVIDNIRISSPAKEELNSILNTFARAVADRAVAITRRSGRKTVGSADLMGAAKLLLPHMLFQHASREANKAVDMFSKNTCGGKSKALRADLYFPPSRARRFLNDPKNLISSYDVHVSRDPPIILAAMIEYIAAEILLHASKQAIDHKRVTITVRHLFKVVQYDEDLCPLFAKLNIDLAGGGVLQNIHSALLPKKNKR